MKKLYPFPPKQYTVISVIAAFCLITTGVGSAGTIKGTVLFTGTPPASKRYPVTIDQYLCGKEKMSEDLILSPTRGIENAVVVLKGLPANLKKTNISTPAKMDQKQCVFVPRVVVVPVGGTVEFMNSDRLLHNVRSDGKENTPFNRAQPHARTISIAFRSPEVLRVNCDLHSWMRGWVVVTEHPFYAVTDSDGGFLFENIPPGDYTLHAWQEILGDVTQNVKVTGDGVQEVTLQMGMK